MASNGRLNEEDDWTNIEKPEVRKRIQNRLSQRKHRRKLRQQQNEGEEYQQDNSPQLTTSETQRAGCPRNMQALKEPPTSVDDQRISDAYFSGAPDSLTYDAIDFLGTPGGSRSYLTPVGSLPPLLSGWETQEEYSKATEEQPSLATDNDGLSLGPASYNRLPKPWNVARHECSISRLASEPDTGSGNVEMQLESCGWQNRREGGGNRASCAHCGCDCDKGRTTTNVVVDYDQDGAIVIRVRLGHS